MDSERGHGFASIFRKWQTLRLGRQNEPPECVHRSKTSSPRPKTTRNYPSARRAPPNQPRLLFTKLLSKLITCPFIHKAEEINLHSQHPEAQEALFSHRGALRGINTDRTADTTNGQNRDLWSIYVNTSTFQRVILFFPIRYLLLVLPVNELERVNHHPLTTLLIYICLQCTVFSGV